MPPRGREQSKEEVELFAFCQRTVRSHRSERPPSSEGQGQGIHDSGPRILNRQQERGRLEDNLGQNFLAPLSKSTRDGRLSRAMIAVAKNFQASNDVEVVHRKGVTVSPPGRQGERSDSTCERVQSFSLFIYFSRDVAHP
jgi:hypothetical protein